jgi:hypothetical protein
MRFMKRRLLPVLALILALPLAAQEAREPNNRNVRFGLPAPADQKDREAYLIERPQYVSARVSATKPDHTTL